MFYTLPLIYSYLSFLYDNYSDVELSYSYYKWGNFTKITKTSSKGGFYQ